MFLNNSRSGYKGTAQYAAGDFLIVFCNENELPAPGRKNQLRALVRKVALRQSGHFMTGHVTLLGAKLWLSGAYGHDGLPVEITEYKRRNVPETPETFESHEARTAFYDALAKIKFENIERIPGLWARLHPLPDDLTLEFWSGGGHNGPGKEYTRMREWALANIETLRHLKEAP